MNKDELSELNKSKNINVVATKYRLKENINNKNNVFDKKGSMEKVLTNFIPRDYVEKRNETPNNEFYVIDEVATAKLIKLRDKEISSQNIKKEK